MIEIILDSVSSLFKAVDMILKSKDLTLGAILVFLAPFVGLWVKISKEKEKKARALLVERRQLQIAFNVNEIMEALKVESKWSLQEIGSTNTVQKKSKHSLLTFCKAMFTKNLSYPRRKNMNALKSTKFWLAIIGAIVPVINSELGLHLDPTTILGILGLFATAIAGIAHVDAKKAQNVTTQDTLVQNGGTSNVDAQPSNTIGINK